MQRDAGKRLEKAVFCGVQRVLSTRVVVNAAPSQAYRIFNYLAAITRDIIPSVAPTKGRDKNTFSRGKLARRSRIISKYRIFAGGRHSRISYVQKCSCDKDRMNDTKVIFWEYGEKEIRHYVVVSRAYMFRG